MLEYIHLPGALAEVEWFGVTPDQVVAIKVNRYVLSEERVTNIKSSEDIRLALIKAGVNAPTAGEAAPRLWTQAVDQLDRYRTA